jgi:hypothetical protein
MSGVLERLANIERAQLISAQETDREIRAIEAKVDLLKSELKRLQEGLK